MSSEKQRIHADFMLDELKDKAREWGDLVKENRRLQEVEQEHQRINGELREENNRLNNIINELENYIRARADDNYTCSICSVMTDDLLNILKGSDKE